MYFESAKIVGFRNFRAVSIDFSSRLNVLVGDNGQGKTNLIEALYFGTQGHSFRVMDSEALINADSLDSSIDLSINRNGLQFQLRTFLNSQGKSFYRNKKKISAKEQKKNFSIVDFSPESLSFIKEGMDLRRRLLDEVLMFSSDLNIDLIFDYRKALRSRNKILKDFAIGKTQKKETEDLLEAINPIYFKIAADLTFKRIELTKDFQNDFANAMRYISGPESHSVTLQYLGFANFNHDINQLQMQDVMRQRALELRNAELSIGTSLVGPHKHGVKILFNGNDSRFFCSQGQQRAIILSFKMAQIVYHRKVNGVYPVLMLDDVLSELDLLKQQALVEFLHDINTQIFLTTTDFQLPKSFDLDSVKVMRINNGKILI